MYTELRRTLDNKTYIFIADTIAPRLVNAPVHLASPRLISVDPMGNDLLDALTDQTNERG